MGSVSLAPVLTPHGRLTLVQAFDAPPLTPLWLNACGVPSRVDRATVFSNSERVKLEPRFLLFFPTGENSAQAYVTALCTLPDTEHRYSMRRNRKCASRPRPIRSWTGWPWRRLP